MAKFLENFAALTLIRPQKYIFYTINTKFLQNITRYNMLLRHNIIFFTAFHLNKQILKQ